jgi:hypothetical protein
MNSLVVPGRLPRREPAGRSLAWRHRQSPRVPWSSRLSLLLIRSAPVACCFVALALLSAAPLSAQADSATVTVELRRERREVVITIGPLTIPNTGGGHSHGGSGHETRLYRATWPLTSWFRGFQVELYDSAGQRLSRRHLHHLSMVNLARRQLLYPAFERILGAGQEQASFRAPATIGVPMDTGMTLGTFIGWHNDTGHEIAGARVVMRMQYLPSNWMPRPTPVRPLWLDVSYRSGATDSYDLPPGPSSKTFEFTLPVGGRLLAAGGHLHDHAKFLRLEDAESGKILFELKPRTDSTGRLISVPRKYFGVVGNGLHLRADRRYRLRADYDSPAPEVVKKGAMGLIVAAFVPDDPRRWPVLDLTDAGLQRDLAMLESLGPAKLAAQPSAPDTAMGGHQHHMEHDHQQPK